jgi:serine/threonine protein kinase
VYTLGVLLYEMLTGRRPVDVSGLNLPDAVRRLQEQPPTPLSAHDRRLCGDLEAIVARAMHRDPPARYGSAEQFCDDVERYLTHRPLEARAHLTAYVLRLAVRRNRRVLTGILAATVGLLMLTGLLLDRMFRPGPVPAPGNALLTNELNELSLRLARLALDTGDLALARDALEKCPPGLRDHRWHALSGRVSAKAAGR